MPFRQCSSTVSILAGRLLYFVLSVTSALGCSTHQGFDRASSRTRHELTCSDGRTISCFEPPPDVMTSEVSVLVGASIGPVKQALVGSGSQSVRYERIRKEVPSLQTLEVLEFRLCVALANDFLTEEAYSAFLNEFLPRLRTELASLPPSEGQERDSSVGLMRLRIWGSVIAERSPDYFRLGKFASSQEATPLDTLEIEGSFVSQASTGYSLTAEFDIASNVSLVGSIGRVEYSPAKPLTTALHELDRSATFSASAVRYGGGLSSRVNVGKHRGGIVTTLGAVERRTTIDLFGGHVNVSSWDPFVAVELRLETSVLDWAMFGVGVQGVLGDADVITAAAQASIGLGLFR